MGQLPRLHPDRRFPNGWSARGGFTRNPYVLDWDPCGSSPGSAVAAAANLCSVTVGTETDGSVVCPAGNNLVVGLKPTLGLVPQQGIIPIAHRQDTAGPDHPQRDRYRDHAQCDETPFGPVAGHALPADYTAFLQRGALRGARIGVDRRQFSPDYFALPEINAVIEQAIEVMADLGATIVDTRRQGGRPVRVVRPEFNVLLYEFKVDIAAYMPPCATRGCARWPTSSRSTRRTARKR